ncbi:MAG: arginine--tRNA ligase [Pseudomonadota bacterium]
MKELREKVVGLLAGASGRTASDLEAALEIPPKPEQGDLALPCFRWAKEEKISPPELANRWKEALLAHLPAEFDRVEVQGGYLNFFLKRSFVSRSVLTEIRKSAGKYGFVTKKPAPVAVIEYSSPNIAKPFSIGHLRSTNIGAALSRIFAARGWRVVQLNHLGDWGTQFGKLISAYRRWGKAEMLAEKPMEALYKLYVRFHEEEVSDPTLIEEARDWFARLEQKDPEAQELWEWFRELTMRELERIYKMLGVSFDHYWGESFYTDRLPGLLEDLEEKNLTKISEEATVIDLEPYGLPTCLIKKKDDSSLYLTRDIAAAIYRFDQLKFDRMIYVVGAPQRLHFQQLFKVVELMGYSWADRLEHIMFGHISFGDESMSTRRGNIVFLAEVIDRATDLANKIVAEKNPDLENRNEVARQVGLGAILYADLSAKRIKDVKFSWEEMLSFEGETGPYLQYTFVRAQSILRKWGQPIDETAALENLTTDEESALVRELSHFPMVLAKAEMEREPFLIAQYLIDLTKNFNRFYTTQRILDAPPELAKARVVLVSGFAELLKTGLKLLGIPTPDRM